MATDPITLVMEVSLLLGMGMGMIVGLVLASAASRLNRGQRAIVVEALRDWQLKHHTTHAVVYRMATKLLKEYDHDLE
jgi:hypothetical protein